MTLEDLMSIAGWDGWPLSAVLSSRAWPEGTEKPDFPAGLIHRGDTFEARPGDVYNMEFVDKYDQKRQVDVEIEG